MSLEEAIRYVPSNGRYTLRRFEDDPRLAEHPGILYFIKIAAKDGVLHKIGITQRPITARFQSMEFETLAIFEGRLQNLFFLEQEILELFHENHYRAEEEFEGKTETFLLMPEEEKELLDELLWRATTHKITIKALNSPGPDVA